MTCGRMSFKVDERWFFRLDVFFGGAYTPGERILQVKVGGLAPPILLVAGD